MPPLTNFLSSFFACFFAIVTLSSNIFPKIDARRSCDSIPVFTANIMNMAALLIYVHQIIYIPSQVVIVGSSEVSISDDILFEGELLRLDAHPCKLSLSSGCYHSLPGNG